MDRRVMLVAAVGLLAGACAAGLVVYRGLLRGAPAAQEGPLVVHSDPGVGERRSPPRGAPNVVLVVGCTVRRDQVGTYGGPPGVTPFLDTLAQRGAVVEDPIAAAPWTRPASASILTGLHGLELGIVETAPIRNDRGLSADAVTLAERFRDAGYVTIGATTNPNLNAVFGFDQGFDAYVQLEHLWRTSMIKLPGSALMPTLLDQIDTRRHPDRPLYVQVALVDSHAPFQAGPEDFEATRADGIPEELARYRAALHGMDRTIATLFEALESRGLTADDTVFVFVSDHGEGLMMPPHHGRSHGRYLYPSAVHAVWIAAGPSIRAGQRVAGVASQVDVAPTLLSLALGDAGGLPGRDLAAALRGEQDRTGRPRAFSDTWYVEENRAAVYGDDLACMLELGDGEFQAPTGRFVPGCYDRSADPEYRAPLEPTDAVQARMVEVLRWRTELARKAPAGEVVGVDEELSRQLEVLGYTQAGEGE